MSTHAESRSVRTVRPSPLAALSMSRSIWFCVRGMRWIARLSAPAQSMSAMYSPAPVCSQVVDRESTSTTPTVTFEFLSPGRG